jgi:hypothetical protein
VRSGFDELCPDEQADHEERKVLDVVQAMNGMSSGAIVTKGRIMSRSSCSWTRALAGDLLTHGRTCAPFPRDGGLA